MTRFIGGCFPQINVSIARSSEISRGFVEREMLVTFGTSDLLISNSLSEFPKSE